MSIGKDQKHPVTGVSQEKLLVLKEEMYKWFEEEGCSFAQADQILKIVASGLRDQKIKKSAAKGSNEKQTAVPLVETAEESQILEVFFESLIKRVQSRLLGRVDEKF